MTISSRLAAWKRFSLRSLLLFMTGCCLLLALWSIYINPFRLQAQSAASVSRLGGEIRTVPADGPTWQRWLVTMVLGRDSFVCVRWVDLAGGNVDDQALQSLTGLIYLRQLNLDRTGITDEGTSALQSLQQLDFLSMRFTHISDRGVENLASLPELKTLYLTSTRVSDASIANLSKLRALNELYVRWTRISDAGAQRIEEALPNCSVYYYSLAEETTLPESIGGRSASSR